MGMLRHKTLAMALGAALTALPRLCAGADDRPPAQPIRDVTVEYTLTELAAGGEQSRPRPIKVYWAGGGAHMHIEMSDERSYVILDRDTKLMTVVLLDEHGYVQLPYDPKKPTGFTVPSGIALKRAGTEVIVGNACNVWVQKDDDNSTQLCVTDDGVLLHAENRTPARIDTLKATSVIYGPVPSSALVPPADFQKLPAPHSAKGARAPG
jgi:hypothetical protein